MVALVDRKYIIKSSIDIIFYNFVVKIFNSIKIDLISFVIHFRVSNLKHF